VSRHTERNKLLNVLGFFVHGIPVIFLKLDVALPGDVSRGRQYLHSYRLMQMRPATERRILEGDVLDSYEYAITPVHEIRHFHDAVLSPPLFELFMLSCKQQLYVLQLAGRFRRVTPNDLPLSLEEAARHVDDDGRKLVEMLRIVKQNYDTAYRHVFDEVSYSGGRVSIRDLLESNAIITEVTNLISVHGLETADAYYRGNVLQLAPEYHRLLKEFMQKCGGLMKGLETLHGMIAHCLYGSDNPALAFATLMEQRPQAGDLTAFAQPESVRKLFADEGKLKRRIRGIRIETAEGFELNRRSTARAGLNGILRLYEVIYASRETLIEIYIKKWGYNLQQYLQETGELPTPPVLFFVDESELLGVRESELAKRRPDYYVIRGHRSDGDVAVVAGLTSMVGTKAAIRMEIADSQLATRYCYERLFETRDVVYAPLIDEVYQQILERQILSSEDEEAAGGTGFGGRGGRRRR